MFAPSWISSVRTNKTSLGYEGALTGHHCGRCYSLRSFDVSWQLLAVSINYLFWNENHAVLGAGRDRTLERVSKLFGMRTTVGRCY